MLIDRVDENRVGLIDDKSVFHLIDLSDGQTEFTCQLEGVDWENAAGLNVFAQDETVFVDVARSNSPMVSQLPLSSTSIRLPSRSIGGDLIAIRPNTEGVGEVVWRADLGRSTVLTGPEYRLPVLLVSARIRPEDSGREQMKLTVIRTADGEVLSEHLAIPRTLCGGGTTTSTTVESSCTVPKRRSLFRVGGVADVVKRGQKPVTEFVSIQR